MTADLTPEQTSEAIRAALADSPPSTGRAYTADEVEAILDPPSWHEGAYWPPKATRDAKERAVRHTAGLEGQDATREPHDATEAAQGRVERYAEAARGGITVTPTYRPPARPEWFAEEIARRVIAVADQEQAEKDATIAELRAEVERLKDALHIAMSALTTSRDVLHAASGLPAELDGEVDLIDETVLGLRNRAEAAEARVAELEATVARVDQWYSGPLLYRTIRKALEPPAP